MQSTGHTSTQAVSLVLMHGSAITYVIESSREQRYQFPLSNRLLEVKLLLRDRLRANGNKTVRAEALSGVEGSQYVGAMLSLDYPDGPQARDALGDAGQLHRL